MERVLNLADKAIASLDKGAILVSGEKPNLMTIGWGSVGIMWFRPVFMVPVRFSRHSHDLMEAGDEFTVCFPKPGKMTKVIGFCGSKSGRNHDKAKELKLELEGSKQVSVPHLKDAGIVFECKLIYKSDLDVRGFEDKDVLEECYPERNFHTMYYAEIVEAYEMD